MMGLTERQAECLRFVAAYTAEHGVSPSYSEMASALGMKSKSGINRLVHGLVERGYAEMKSKRARSLILIQHVCPNCGHQLSQPATRTRAGDSANGDSHGLSNAIGGSFSGARA